MSIITLAEIFHQQHIDYFFMNTLIWLGASFLLGCLSLSWAIIRAAQIKSEKTDH